MILVASVDRYSASKACWTASQGLVSTYYSPDPENVEAVARYNPEIYHFISRERFIELLSSGQLRYTNTPPEEADTILVCGDALKTSPSSLRQLENLVKRLSAVRAPRVIIFSLLGRPGTCSRLLKLFLQNLVGLDDSLAHGYLGITDWDAPHHPAYYNDDRAGEMISMITRGRCLRYSTMEDAEAATIAMLATQAAEIAVHHQVYKIFEKQPPSSIGPVVGWENESVLRLFAELETVHGKLLTHVKEYLERRFTDSCRLVAKRVREILRSKKDVVNILLVSEDTRTGHWLNYFLPSKGCRLHTREPVHVYEMVEVRGRLDMGYDLVIVDGRLGRIARLLGERLGWDKITILSGVTPTPKGV